MQKKCRHCLGIFARVSPLTTCLSIAIEDPGARHFKEYHLGAEMLLFKGIDTHKDSTF
jgi:hypothetical protein